MKIKNLAATRRIDRLAFLLWTIVVAGCADSSGTSDVPLESSLQQPAMSPTEVSVEIKSWQEVQDWVATQRGKVVVIDVWSTFCLTCMQEFPHFLELQQEYGADVACASLSVDFYGGTGNQPEDVKLQVLKFLKSQQATTRNFISSDPDTYVLKQIKTVAIPAALVYDKSGHLNRVFNNEQEEFGPTGFQYEQDITPLVEQLIAATPSKK